MASPKSGALKGKEIVVGVTGSIAAYKAAEVVSQLVQRDAQLVEVLGPKEYETEHLPGAINIPLKTLSRQTTKLLDTRRPVIPYCHDYQ